MVTPELITYIKNQLALGQSAENVKNILLSNNWPEADVTEALRTITGVPAEPVAQAAPVVTAEPVINVATPETKVESITKKTESVSSTTQASSPVFTMGQVEISGATGVTHAKYAPNEPQTTIKSVEPELSVSQSVPLDISQPPSTLASQGKISAPSVKIANPFKKNGDIVKIGIGIAIGIVIGLGAAFGWTAVKKLLLKSPIPAPSPLLTVSPSPEAVVSVAPEALPLIPYTNNQYGFSLEYPQSWHLDESGYLGTVVVFSESEQGGTNINVTTATATPKTSLEAFVENSIKDIQKSLSDYIVLSNSTTTVNGVPARLVEGSIPVGDMKFRNAQLYVSSGSGSYIIVTATCLDAAWDQYKPLFLKVFQALELV